MAEEYRKLSDYLPAVLAKYARTPADVETTSANQDFVLQSNSCSRTAFHHEDDKILRYKTIQ